MTEEKFETFCREYNTEHKLVAAKFPYANEMVEIRIKYNIVPVVETTLDFENERWDRAISSVERKMNATVNKTTVFFRILRRCSYDEFSGKRKVIQKHEQIRNEAKE